MEQDDQNQAEEARQRSEDDNSELSDTELENVAGGFQKMPPDTNPG